MAYSEALPIAREITKAIKSPKRMKIWEAADETVRISKPGGYNGPFKSEFFHPLIQPMEAMTERTVEAVIFAGPAQTGKTLCMVDNALAYMLYCDPSDMMIIEKSRTEAMDYSRTRVDRMLEASPKLGQFIISGSNDDNVLAKMFTHGAALRINWPSKNALAGKSVPFVVLPDYDRMPEDVGGEGGVFFKALKRTETFMSRGMVAAESSPSRPLVDPGWKPPQHIPGQPLSHQAPPTTGILGLFNTGDRRRLYWQCPQCSDFYMIPPGPEGFWWPDIDTMDIMEKAEQACAICTSCGAMNPQSQRKNMISSSEWLKEGELIDSNGKITGTPRRSKRASFWQPGATASFQDWSALVRNYLNAVEQYEMSLDESAMRDNFNLDWGMFYISKATSEDRDPNDYQARPGSPQKTVQPWVVRLIVTVDVQGNRFVVQVHGVGTDCRIAVIDRFSLRYSTRPRRDGGEGYEPMEPGTYQSDWDILEKLFDRTYRSGDGSKLFKVDFVLCDSGGRAKATAHAYKFWEKMRAKGKGSNFVLSKGSSHKMAEPTAVTYPGKRKGSIAKPTMPLLFHDPTHWKDMLYNRLGITEDGPGRIYFPADIGAWFFEELVAEVRGQDGRWTKRSQRARNEAWDLLVMCLVAIYRRGWQSTPPPLAEHRKVLPGDAAKKSGRGAIKVA